MEKLFQRIIDNNFLDLQGTTVDASIPLSESLINEFIKAGLKGNKTISAIQVSIHPQNQVSANIKTTLLPWALNLKLKLDRSVDLASYASPKLRAWMENNRLLGSLGAFFNALPEGIKLYGNQVVVDLGAFLNTPEEKKYFDLVKSVGIATQEGRILLDVKIEVE
jgi:hypothetical protein